MSRSAKAARPAAGPDGSLTTAAHRDDVVVRPPRSVDDGVVAVATLDHDEVWRAVGWELRQGTAGHQAGSVGIAMGEHSE